MLDCWKNLKMTIQVNLVPNPGGNTGELFAKWVSESLSEWSDYVNVSIHGSPCQCFVTTIVSMHALHCYDCLPYNVIYCSIAEVIPKDASILDTESKIKVSANLQRHFLKLNIATLSNTSNHHLCFGHGW